MGLDDPAPNVSQTILIGLANVWRPTTGPMTMPRSYHTATPLADGRVLIAGGLDQWGASTASTELYDPATRTFTSAGNMPSKSASHAAVRLADGRVLVTGGGNSSAQIFTPNAGTGTWAPAGSLSSNRSYHTATVLPSGRVLIIGGADQAGKTTNTTIVYDPATGSFTTGPTMDKARERHTATLLTSGPNAGKVLVVGGRVKVGNNYQTHATYQLCTVTTCTASAGGIAARHTHAAVELVFGTNDTDVLVTGGANGSTDLASSDRYDGLAATWSSIGSIVPYTIARRELTVSELPLGQAIVAGGRNGTTPQSAADRYASSFGSAQPMGTPRAGHTATSLRDSTGNIIGVLVTGGVSTSGISVNTAETYGIR